MTIQPQMRMPAQAVESAYSRFGGQVVFKWSRMGYDGKGVCLAEDSPQGRIQAVEFCKSSLKRGVPVYAERKIPFKRELAIIGCRGHRGDFATYPLVLSEQQHGICRQVLGPATQLGASPALESQAREAARKIAESMKLEGSFALELFETSEGSLSINEIAPRVHNSGHYTQDACPASQFENHWRGVLGLPLGETRAAAAFGMLNLLGPEGVVLSLPRRRTQLPFPPVPAPLVLHWYAKAEVRPWRKVGHLNAALNASHGPGAAGLPDFATYQTSWANQLALLQTQALRSPSQ